MPLTQKQTLQSDVAELIKLLPTVKEAVLAKQGLRNLRAELLYRHPDHPINLMDTEKLESLGVTELLLEWLNSPAVKPALDDIKQGHPDALLQAFDEALKDVELVQLTLAYTAPVEDLVRYHQWFVQVLGRPVMMDVKVDKELLAGIRFSYQNQLHDYSLQARLP